MIEKYVQYLHLKLEIVQKCESILLWNIRMYSIFTKFDFTILRKLSRDRNIHITKSDKGCAVELLNKADYHQNADDIITDPDKFEESHIEEKKLLMKLEDKLYNVLKSLKAKGNITESFYNECYSSESQLGNLCGLPKVHNNNCLVRSIVAAYGSFNLYLGKELASLISQSTLHPYILKIHMNLPTPTHSI